MHEKSYYNTGYGQAVMDKQTGDEDFEHGQIVLVKDHINWQWTQRAFKDFGQNGILQTYGGIKPSGNYIGWCHFYKEPSQVRRLAHLPKVGEILYRRHIWNYPDKPMVSSKEEPYWDFKCEIIPSNCFDYGVDDEGNEYSDTGIREYKILECPEHPEWVGTRESCIMEFHENGSKEPTGWNVHFATEV
jgi:hypothetical protein